MQSTARKSKEEQERVKKLSLRPRFAPLDLWRQQAIWEILMRLMQENIERLANGMEEMTDVEVRGFIRADVIRLRL